MKESEVARYLEEYKKFRKLRDSKQDLVSILSEPFVKRVTQIVSQVDNQMSAVMRDFTPKGDDNFKPQVIENLKAVMKTAINSPLDPPIREFLLSYTRILSCWNYYVGKDPEIESQLTMIDRVIKQSLTIIEAIEVLRALIKHVEPMLRFTPPSFEMNRAYLENLSKDLIEEKKDDESKELPAALEKV